MTPKELRISLIRSAFAGSLTTRTDLENDARLDLIEKWAAENVKKPRPLDLNDVPTDSPANWKWVSFSKIVTLEKGKSITGESLPYLEARYLRGKASKTVLNSGEVVAPGAKAMLVDGENSGEVFLIPERGYLGSTFKVLNINPNVEEDFVIWFLRLHQDDYRNNKKGAAIPHLNKEIFYSMPFPLPSYEEQKKIVGKIESLLPLTDEYERVYSELEALNKGFPKSLEKSLSKLALRGKLVPQIEEEGSSQVIVDELQNIKRHLQITKEIRTEKPLPPIDLSKTPFDVPSSWRWVRFGDLGVYKKGPFGSALVKGIFVKKGPQTIKVYEQKNAIQKDATLGEYYITAQYFEEHMKSFEVFSGDIIVSCAGTIGEIYVMPPNIERGIINQALMRMRIFEPIYIPYFLFVFDSLLKANAKASSSGTAIKNIPPFDVLKNYLVPIPPFSEQKRIVSKIEELTSLIMKLRAMQGEE